MVLSSLYLSVCRLSNITLSRKLGITVYMHDKVPPIFSARFNRPPGRNFTSTSFCLKDSKEAVSESELDISILNDKNMAKVFDSAGVFLGAMSIKKLQMKAKKENLKVFHIKSDKESLKSGPAIRSYKLLSHSEFKNELSSIQNRDFKEKDKVFRLHTVSQEHDIQIKIKRMCKKLEEGKVVNVIIKNSPTVNLQKSDHAKAKELCRKVIKATENLTLSEGTFQASVNKLSLEPKKKSKIESDEDN